MLRVHLITCPAAPSSSTHLLLTILMRYLATRLPLHTIPCSICRRQADRASAAAD